MRGILRNSPKPLPSFAKATEGSPRLHPRSRLWDILRRRINERRYMKVAKLLQAWSVWLSGLSGLFGLSRLLVEQN